jgi:putative transposase
LRKEGLVRDRPPEKIQLGVLISRICAELGLDAEAVRRPNKTKRPAMARGIISYLAIHELGYKGGEVGRELHLGPAGVSLAVRRGEIVVRENPALLGCMEPEK